MYCLNDTSNFKTPGKQTFEGVILYDVENLP